MKIGVYIDYICIILLVFLVFCDIPFYMFLIPADIIMICLISLMNGKRLIKEVKSQNNYGKTNYDNTVIYIVSKKVMGNHNVATVGYKNPIIFIEQKVNSDFSEATVHALIMHEIGHIQQKKRMPLFLLKHLSEIFICIGTHNAIYSHYVTLYVLCIIGILLFLATSYFEKTNEYQADKYALSHGVEKKDLILGLTELERLNGRNQNRITHPALKQRIEKIESYC